MDPCQGLQLPQFRECLVTPLRLQICLQFSVGDEVLLNGPLAPADD